MPASTVTVSSRSKSKHQGPRVSRGESASGPITAIEPRLPASSGSRSPSLRSSTADRSAAMRATSRCAGSSSTSAARASSTYGSSNRPIRSLASSTRRTLASSVAGSTAPRARPAGRWAYAGSVIAISMSRPGVDRPGGSVGQVGGEAVRLQAAGGVGVAHHEPLEAPELAQHLGEEPAVAGGGDAVERHVRRHHVAGARLDGRAERREVGVPQLGVGEVDLVVVTPAERGAVPREVLGPGDDAVGSAEPLALEAPHLGDRHRRAEVRVLAGALDDAAPARVAGDVDHRREGPVDADRPRLPRGDRLAAGDGVRVPRGRHRDRHRQDRPEPVDDVEREQRRDAVPVAVDDEPLEAVDLGGVGDEQQGPELAARHRGLGPGRLVRVGEVARRVGLGEPAEVEVLRQLAGLLLRRHRREQLLDPGPDPRSSTGCALVMGATLLLFAGTLQPLPRSGPRSMCIYLRTTCALKCSS